MALPQVEWSGSERVIEESFARLFGGMPEVTARAPGRVNLIGEHTDYNDGLVLPAAIDRYVWFAGRRRSDRRVHARALDFQDSVEFSLDGLYRDQLHPWSNYLRGVVKVMEEAGHRLAGADVVFGGEVPREAGLSSSAAVEVGAAAFWGKLMNLQIRPVEVAKLARRAENEFVGVPSGIMDQFASACGRRDHLLFLDCRDLHYRYVPLDARAKIVVCNSGVKRALAQSEYEVRVGQCREAVARISSSARDVKSLREVGLDDLEAARGHLSEVLLKRARHVVTENQRVLDAVQSLECGNLERFGELMNASHESLRDDYEVSCRELDVLVNLARNEPGVLGARMTGAGFGGCTVNLVITERAQSLAGTLRQGFERELGLKADAYLCRPSDGALTDWN